MSFDNVTNGISNSENQLRIENELIQLSLAGNRKAQYEIYTRYAKAMYNVCWRIVNDADEAQDVLQEVFIKIFQNLRDFKGSSTLGAWIKRITVNESLNYMKKKKINFSKNEKDLSDNEKLINEEDNWDETLLQVTKIKNAIPLLPDGFRIVLSLYLLEGYDHSEIAEILGITESTSKSQFNRAKVKLKEFIKNNN
jgi:RNA polymerase sigma-70 factor (ECF subfamily)